jgi:hypothetical protein
MRAEDKLNVKTSSPFGECDFFMMKKHICPQCHSAYAFFKHLLPVNNVDFHTKNNSSLLYFLPYVNFSGVILLEGIFSINILRFHFYFSYKI